MLNKHIFQRAKAEAIRCIDNLDVPGSFCDSLTEDWVKCLNPLGRKIEECNKNVILKGASEASIKTTIAQADFICRTDVSNFLGEFLLLYFHVLFYVFCIPEECSRSIHMKYFEHP